MTILCQGQDFASAIRLNSWVIAYKWLINRTLPFGGAVAFRDGVIDGITSQIEHYMDLLSARQKLVASNISNIDTPGYKSKDIDFQSEFQALISGTAAAPPPHVIDTPGLVVKSDGNNVSLDRETRLLSENALRFNVASTFMKARLRMVEAAIKEGQSS